MALCISISVVYAVAEYRFRWKGHRRLRQNDAVAGMPSCTYYADSFQKYGRVLVHAACIVGAVLNGYGP